MILQLTIRNFAIIEELHLEFHEGFNVLSGETGAGKSILMDAFGLLLGGRGSAEWIRHGEKKAEIEGLFLIDKDSHSYKKLQEFGIECEDDMIVIRRDLNIQGKSICRINGQLATISMLRELGETLVNFHSQHEHHQLLQPHRHLYWLDAYGGKAVEETLAEYQRMYRQFLKGRKELENLTRNEKEMMQRMDLLQYQLEEIQRAQLQIGEDEKLAEIRKRQIHSEKITNHIFSAYEALTGEQKCLDWLGMAMSHLEEISSIDPFLKEKFQQIEESFYNIEEVAREIHQYADGIEFDEHILAQIEERLDTIQGLKRKYGESILAILEYAATIEEELERIEHKDELYSALSQQLADLKKDLLLEAKTLSRLRQESALSLSSEVQKELSDLHMDKAKFFVEVKNTSEEEEIEGFDLPGNEYGMDQVEFLISTNPGEPLKPLSKIASGGELSRVSLSLRTVLARLDDVPTLVFDEVDTGVSGKVSQSIGEKLYRISKSHQVLAITHHPQVASFADVHFLIEKETSDDRTITKVSKLNHDQRILELARMVGGAEISSSAKLHAADLLRLANQYKKSGAV